MSHERKDGLTYLKDEARTPPSLFKRLDERFHFAIDLCCTRQNCLCHAGVFKGTTNSLVSDWKRAIELSALQGYDYLIGYCNPPYSRGNIYKFVAKAYSESRKGAIVVMLLPADISTAWFRDYCMMAAEWIIIKGRVHFNNPDGTPMVGSPKFGSIAVVFDAEARRKHGLVVSEMDWR
jgi:site-specific DNA-methyltransferase (adenine-specific)